VDVIDDHHQSAFTVTEGIRRAVLDESELDYLRSRVRTLQEMAATTEHG
jgi:hypothetical protein